MKNINKAPFINRKAELSFLQSWIEEEPKNLLFIFGPKSSGKTTMLQRFINNNLVRQKFDIKHFNLRKILIVSYKDFIKTFFEIDYSKSKDDIKERREYNLKVFKLSTEILKGLDEKELDPFVVMEKEIQTAAAKGWRSVIVIDELQALEGIYLNGQRELLKELFNFFVAMTKEDHLCHVMIASSDGYFIERIYKDSKLKKTSKFLEVDYLGQDDIMLWLGDLRKHSNISSFTLSAHQKEQIWNNFGGSCWEISAFLGDLLLTVQNGKIADKNFNTILQTKLIAARSMFVEYASLSKPRRALLQQIHKLISQGNILFEEEDLEILLANGFYTGKDLKAELIELVRQNILAYNPVTAVFSLQGKSMEIGLDMYIERSAKRLSAQQTQNKASQPAKEQTNL